MPSRTKCPLDKYCRPKVCAILLDIVPFPDPGGPMITARNNFAMSSSKQQQQQQSDAKDAQMYSILLVREFSSSRLAHMDGA